jgi:hypothetical protein
VLVRRRLANGWSIGGGYTFSRAIDDASSFGAGSGIVAQDALNLSAERGLSNNDQPHRFNGDFLVQLPFGQNKHWLHADNFPGRILGNWQLNGTWNFASGTPLTARVIGASSDLLRGTNGSLRADSTGLPVALAHPTTARWFNTAAFSIPTPGVFGTAGRNTIRGPGTQDIDMSLNKTIPVGERFVDVRIQANNIFNVPQYRSIDTVVNSPTFGQVTSVGSMRKMQVVIRYRF